MTINNLTASNGRQQANSGSSGNYTPPPVEYVGKYCNSKRYNTCFSGTCTADWLKAGYSLQNQTESEINQYSKSGKANPKDASIYAADAMKGFDANKDGKVSLKEFNAKSNNLGNAINVNGNKSTVDNKELASWMLYEDKDRDGVISPEEAKAADGAAKCNPNGVKQAVSKIYKANYA